MGLGETDQLRVVKSWETILTYIRGVRLMNSKVKERLRCVHFKFYFDHTKKKKLEHLNRKNNKLSVWSPCVDSPILSFNTSVLRTSDLQDLIIIQV